MGSVLEVGLSLHAQQVTEVVTEVQGKLVFSKSFGLLQIHASPQERKKKIKSLKIKYCRLFHGAGQWVNSEGNPFSQHIKQIENVDDYWLTIQTEDGFYILQFFKDHCLSLHKCSTSHQCDIQALRYGRTVEKTQAYTYRQSNSCSGTIDDLILWCQKYESTFILASNNSETLAVKTFERFNE